MSQMNGSNTLARMGALLLAMVMLTFTVVQAQGCQKTQPPEEAKPEAPKKEAPKKEAEAKKAPGAEVKPEKKAESQPDPKEALEAKPGKKLDKLMLDPEFMPATKSGIMPMRKKKNIGFGLTGGTKSP